MYIKIKIKNSRKKEKKGGMNEGKKQYERQNVGKEKRKTERRRKEKGILTSNG